MQAEGEEIEPKTAPQPDHQSSEIKMDESDASPATRGDDRSVEPGAEVDPLASQEHLEVSTEVSEERRGPEGVAEVDDQLEQPPEKSESDHGEVSLGVANSPRELERELQVDLPHDHASNNDDDPEID